MKELISSRDFVLLFLIKLVSLGRFATAANTKLDFIFLLSVEQFGKKLYMQFAIICVKYQSDILACLFYPIHLQK